MSDSLYKVDTTPRLAQWRIENLASCTYRKSDPFKIGNWNWYLSVEKHKVVFVKLFPEISNVTRDNPPIASFIMRVVSSAFGDRKALTHPEIKDKVIKSNEDFVWSLEVPLSGKFIIDVDFLDLKIASPDGGEPCSIWGGEGFTQERSNAKALGSLGKMLRKGIHTDIAINASDGSIGVHRAVLASRSPVFQSMFSHDLKEKELSTINITDMSIETSDKYDISDLREAIHESLLEDIDTKNVLERLQNASLYRLTKLKMSCIQYLVKFGKIFEIRDDFNTFLQSADRDLISEVFAEVLGAWKGY
ncbi:unnamed protein product [Vicia faba]|uniref:BTB domain-containing protein n=1 Tax=Vicia faba TaxID=3906 RepID=A0AAV0ZKB4_VICFA|nr:unnamed protein product [Vicia faba]